MSIKYRMLLSLLAGLALLAACAPAPNLRRADFLSDTSLVSDEPCAPPCWQNITPGITPWNEAFGILATIPALSDIRRNTDRQTGERTISFAYQDGPQCCRLHSRDGQTISSIWLLTAPRLTLGDVIERYGEPAYFRGQDETSDQAFISLIYSEVPMVVYVFADGITNGELSEENDIIGAVYMTAEEMTLALETADELYRWSGYGQLSELLS